MWGQLPFLHSFKTALSTFEEWNQNGFVRLVHWSFCQQLRKTINNNFNCV